MISAITRETSCVARPIEGTEEPEDSRANAFTRLTAARLASLYRLATAILGDPVEAEDATHDAAVRAWERWGSLRDPDRFEAWFQRILINECRDRLRRRRLRPLSVPLPEREAGRPVTDGTEAVAERQALAQAVAALEPDQRIAVVLHFYLQLSAEQIAERTRTRVGTVKSRLHYAVRALRAARDAAERIDGGER
jgi:RNA polymerase sigma-70 factor (ECF subfamily)